MRIAHVVKLLDPAHGGTTTVPLNMAVALAQAGLDVEVWTADAFGWRPPEARTLSGTLRLLERPGPMGLLDRRLVRRFADDLDRIDLLHHHSLWLPYGAGFVRACQRAGTPVVHTLHGMLMEWPISQKTRKKRVYLTLFGARQLRRTSAVQLLNQSEIEQSRRVGVNFRYFELPNGVDTTDLESLPARGTFRRTDPALQEKLIILSMGRLHPVKGPHLLLEAFLDLARERADIALVLAGPDEGMKPALEAMLRGHDAASRVRLPGLVAGGQRLALLADADLFAQCSRHETASMSIIEAAYAGKPILATDRCHCPQLEEAGAGVITAATVPAIRAGLRQLIDERDRLPARGARARRLVEEHFTLQRVTERLIEHYERLIAGERYPFLLDDA